MFAARDLDEVPDVVAVRVVLDVPRASDQETPEAWRERGVQLCYHVLGAVQHLEDCEAVPRVKDYIAFPKPNGYQSLHASVLREPEDQVVEIQIRTRGMHEVAESAWPRTGSTRTGCSSPAARTRRGARSARRRPPPPPSRRVVGEAPRAEWLNAIKDMQDIHSSREFVETIRRPRRRRISLYSGPSPRHRCECGVDPVAVYAGEVLGKRVFVFEGRTDFDLSKGATVLDAAFSIHTARPPPRPGAATRSSSATSSTTETSCP